MVWSAAAGVGVAAAAAVVRVTLIWTELWMIDPALLWLMVGMLALAGLQTLMIAPSSATATPTTISMEVRLRAVFRVLLLGDFHFICEIVHHPL